MNIFRRPDYRSEATQFIDQLNATKPSPETAQRKGRAREAGRVGESESGRIRRPNQSSVTTIGLFSGSVCSVFKKSTMLFCRAAESAT